MKIPAKLVEPTLKKMGVSLLKIPSYPSGGKIPPAQILDKKRGVAVFANPRKGVGSNMLLAHFEMKKGQPRGQAYTAVEAQFLLISGSYIFMTSDHRKAKPTAKINGAKKVNEVLVMRLDGVQNVVVEAGASHVFWPLSEGVIVEASCQGAARHVDSAVRLNDQFSPFLVRLQKELKAGKWEKPKQTEIWRVESVCNC